MSVDKYNNNKFSGDIPLRAGDRRYSQDRIRDFWFLYDHAGLLFQDLNYPNYKFIVRGGVVSKGSGDTLNITAGEGYAKFSAYIPGAWASPPVPKVAVDVDMARIAWTAQTNMAVTGATLDGVTKNYVKVKYAETDGNTRTREKSTGTYSYEVVPGYTFTTTSTAPTDYEVCLATFVGVTSGTFTFSTLDRTVGFNMFRDGFELTANATLAVNRKYVINATSRLNLTLPTTASVGDKIIIEDKGYYGYKILQNASQQVYVMGKGTVPGTTGYFQSRIGLTTIVIECITTDTTWQVTQTNDVWMMKGYICGGDDGTLRNIIDGLDFNLEVCKVITATLPLTLSASCGVSGFSKGYMMGGNASGGVTNVISNFIFSTETCSTISATMDASQYYGAGVYSFSKGYCMGGFTTVAINSIQDMNFSNDSSTSITATLTVSKYNGYGVSGFLKGYHIGGTTGTIQNTIEGLIFSTEVCATISATLDTSKYAGVGVNSFSKGYSMGGNTGSVTAVIEDLNFSTESSAAITATLDTARSSAAGISSLAKGYHCGGNSAITVIEDLNFFVESSNVISATLSYARFSERGFQGYIG